MPTWKLKTPVAFFIFNRPDTTRQVFSEIARARPPKLFLIADGARAGEPDDIEKCSQVRAIVDRIDWDCDVHSHYSEVNLGPGPRVSSGIDWVFEQVEQAIFLEDDCLPDPSMFRYFEEMLSRYKSNPRIAMVSGVNPLFGYRINSDSYYFSQYMQIWGWASWRDRWAGSYDYSLQKWPGICDGINFDEVLSNPRVARNWRSTLQRVFQGKIDTWDYQWAFANWIEGRLYAVPAVNLVTNIGFGADATHTVGTGAFANAHRLPMDFPLKHPPAVFHNLKADLQFEREYLAPPLMKRIMRRIRRAI